MKRTLAVAAVLSMIGFSAYADVTVRKVKFESADVPAHVVSFKTDGTMIDDQGVAGTYTFDEASKKLCGTVGGKTRCSTMGALLKNVGDSTTISDDSGKSGKATLVAAE